MGIHHLHPPQHYHKSLNYLMYFCLFSAKDNMGTDMSSLFANATEVKTASTEPTYAGKSCYCCNK